MKVTSVREVLLVVFVFYGGGRGGGGDYCGGAYAIVAAIVSVVLALLMPVMVAVQVGYDCAKNFSVKIAISITTRSINPICFTRFVQQRRGDKISTAPA